MEVIVDIAHSSVDKIFDYELPEEMEVQAGSRVFVPFGRTQVEGIVLAIKPETALSPEKIKAVQRVIDEQPIITQEQILLAKYMCAKYHAAMAFCLRLMFPAKLRGERIRPKLIRVAKVVNQEKLAEEEKKCYTKEGVVRAKNRLKTICQLKTGGKMPTALLDAPSVRYLRDSGAIEIREEQEYREPYAKIAAEEKRIELSAEQKTAAEQINRAVELGEKQVFLLHGVTGSGKTEVYIACVRRALELGKSAIVLVPEIALTPQMLGEFSRNFPGEIAVFHSGLSDGERFDEWRRLREGRAHIILGARSAVFMPAENLGLIILDEEHEASYKAENFPPYHAAEIAKMRAAINHASVVLASATPLIEDYAKTELGIYQLVELPHRVAGRGMPPIMMVDMKKEFLRGNRGMLSLALQREMAEVLERGEQGILFLNRRGYASSVICPSCGHARMCSHCDVPLKYHKIDGQLHCHYCGRVFPLEAQCPDCGEPFYKLSGAGTERIQEEVQRIFPKARVLRMDFDTTRKKNAHQEIFQAFRKGEADFLIGTQMISRGLDFPGVTLAAVLAADTMLTTGDYRQEERTFAMIEQVGGRAGRVRPGRVVVQTYNPEHYAIQFAAKHDYKGFYQQEIQFRKNTLRPPFSRMFRMVFVHRDEQKAEKVCRKAENLLKGVLEQYKSDIILFVAKPAPVAKLEGKARYHILLKVRTGKSTAAIGQALWKIWESVRKDGALVSFDIDPYDVN